MHKKHWKTKEMEHFHFLVCSSSSSSSKKMAITWVLNWNTQINNNNILQIFYQVWIVHTIHICIISIEYILIRCKSFDLLIKWNPFEIRWNPFNWNNLLWYAPCLHCVWLQNLMEILKWLGNTKKQQNNGWKPNPEILLMN